MTAGPDDPLFIRQWHLDRTATLDALIDLNVVPVWDDYTGRGVRVAVIDRPVESTHPDLDGNYVGITFPTEGHAHGTQVAGLIAAERNGEGGVGVAYGAVITGLGGSTSAVIDAAQYDVANISLGTLFIWDRTTDWKDEYANAADNGRDGLGTIVVVASGNNRMGSLDANLSPFTAHRHTIVIGAVGKSGLVSDYSSEGATLTVVAPSSSPGGSNGITTTDLVGSDGADHGDYTSLFGGTSAATPMVSGVVALMLEANPDLGWRDVQEILAITARHTGSDISGTIQDTERFAWTINNADYVNGGGYHFSNDYGFGLVDALAAVRLAETWTRQQTSANELAASAEFTGSLAVPDADSGGVEVEFTIGAGISTERIDLRVGLTHGDARQVEITIISPSGTESILFFHRGENPDQFGIPRRFQGWTFGSNAFAGEDAQGIWTVRVADTVAGGAGTLGFLALDIYGEAQSLDDTYFYTNEFGILAGVSHGTILSDEDGLDTINAAAVSTASRIDLRGGAASVINGQVLTVAADALIENAVGGDGGDWIAGNLAANWLRGQRGNDRLTGFEGDDILDGGRGDDRLDGGSGNDLLDGGDGLGDAASYRHAFGAVVIDLNLAGPQDSNSAGLDTLIGIERLQGSGFGDILTGSAAANLIRGYDGGDVLAGGDGGDWLEGGAGDDFLSGGAGLDDAAAYGSAPAGVRIDLGLEGPQDTQGAGIDSLDGIERLHGSAFVDELRGDAVANLLAGGHGNDVLAGGGGDDRLIGGAGHDSLSGGEGLDVASYSRSLARVVVDLSLSGPRHTFGAGIDTLGGIEALEGSAFADRLRGDGGDNSLRGAAGDDRLDGGDGDDRLIGGDGDDLLTGGGGADRIAGGAGLRDTADYGGAIMGVTVDLGVRRAQDTVGAGMDRLIGIERLLGSDHDDALTGDSAANLLRGGNGSDHLSGGDGDDVLAGNAGDDIIDGGGGTDIASFAGAAAGVVADLRLTGRQADGGDGADLLIGIEGLTGGDFADRLTGDAGANALRGSGGADRLIGGDGNDLLNGGAGNDRLLGGDGAGDRASYAGSAAGVVVDLRLLVAQDTLGSGLDILSGIERLTGSAHADTLIGDAGANRLSGLAGADRLDGGDGDDFLAGGAGDDILLGGAGGDTLAGGMGSDIFTFAAVGDVDAIADFVDGSDRIDLTAFGPSLFISIYTQNVFFPDDHNVYVYVDPDPNDPGFLLITLTDFLLLNPFSELTTDDMILAPPAGIA